MPDTIKIRFLRPWQVSQAVHVAREAFGAHMVQAARQDFMASFQYWSYVRPITFVALAGREVIGVVQSINGYIAPRLQNFCWLCVAPDWQGHKIGHELLKAAEIHTIRTRFKSKPGTFLLVADFNPDYYVKAGYRGQTLMASNVPVLTKHYVPFRVEA